MPRQTTPAPAVVVAAVDPSDPQARTCVNAYFAELDRRFDAGFDPNPQHQRPTTTSFGPRRGLLIAGLARRTVPRSGAAR